MHFTIVATKEKRGVYFTAVPYKWVLNNNILCWPDSLPHSVREKLRSDSGSIPEDNWNQYPCIVKFDNIKTFQGALDVEESLTKCSDSESEEQLFEKISNKNKNTSKSTSVVVTNRNDLFENRDAISIDISSDHGVKNKNSVIRTLSENINTDLLTDLPIILEVQEAEQPANVKSFVEGSVEGGRYLSVENAKEMVENFKEIKKFVREEINEAKTEILLKLNKEHAKINVILDQLLKLMENKQLDECQKHKEVVDLLQDYKLPLTEPTELDNLNLKLKQSQEFKKQLVEFLIKVAGTSGEQDGQKVGYKIIDILIHPELLTHYTWTGVNRQKTEEKKMPFQVFGNITELLVTVLIAADNRFTRQKTINFLKDSVLKHAKKRSQRKRASKCTNHENDVLEEYFNPDNPIIDYTVVEFEEPEVELADVEVVAK